MRYQTPTAEITLINAREDILLMSGNLWDLTSTDGGIDYTTIVSGIKDPGAIN